MAYIYRYECYIEGILGNDRWYLRDDRWYFRDDRWYFRDDRWNFIPKLSNFKNEIERGLEELFKTDLKEVIVTNNFIQFKLYNIPNNNELRRMKKLLVEVINGDLGNIHLYKVGFRRMKHNLIGRVTHDEAHGEHVEWLDISAFNFSEESENVLYTWGVRYDEIELGKNFGEYADAYFRKKQDLEDTDELPTWSYMQEYQTDYSSDVSKKIRNLLYVDVLDVSMDDESDYIMRTYRNNGTGPNVRDEFKYLRNNMSGENAESEAYYVYASAYLVMTRGDEQRHGDGESYSEKGEMKPTLDIVKLQYIDDINILKVIKNTFDEFENITYPSASNVNEEAYILNKSSEYEFTVHNVGQALATSLKSEQKEYEVYFDYGQDKKAYVLNGKLEVSAYTKIIISHLHLDHWSGVQYNPDAYKCTWYIPSQKKKMQIAKVLAKVFLEGEVMEVNKELSIYPLKIDVNNIGVSNYHKSGLIGIIDNNKKVVVMGDQRYDSVGPGVLPEEIDVLVASHHGGLCGDIKCIPSNTSDGEIIYSYGVHASYNHPCKNVVKEYVNLGWVKEHRTLKDGEYNLRI